MMMGRNLPVFAAATQNPPSCLSQGGGFWGSTAQFSKRQQREILFQDKVWKTQEYFVYFKFFKLQYWDKRSADVRRCNCAVLP